MALKQDFAKQIDPQISVWQAQIKGHQERLKQAGRQGPGRYRAGHRADAEQAEQAKKLLAQVQQAGEAAGKNVHSANQALEQLQKGWGRRPQTLRLSARPRPGDRRSHGF